MVVLSPVFGLLVGFSLGLTGGGGSIFAVPLLVYGLAVAPREAVGISLAAVGATALIGAGQRLQAGEVEMGTGLLFAVAGMMGAPLGSWLGAYVPEPLLLVLFACLMTFVAVRMWFGALQRSRAHTANTDKPSATSRSDTTGTCQRDARGRLELTSRCVGVLAGVGLLTGVLSGLFGVGGGFVIVPALVLVSDMDIHRAVATSLAVIALISVAGVASYVIAGRPLPLTLTGLFVLGGVAGMVLGTRCGRKLSGPTLQKGFAVALVVVATFMITKSLF
jgi:uncharacterized membrane protein YfcA